jgi:membrane protein implicated in regulation of membrane protease activity
MIFVFINSNISLLWTAYIGKHILIIIIIAVYAIEQDFNALFFEVTGAVIVKISALVGIDLILPIIYSKFKMWLYRRKLKKARQKEDMVKQNLSEERKNKLVQISEMIKIQKGVSQLKVE